MRGRPKVEMTREQLITLHKSGYTARRMALLFHCSTSLVYKRLYEEGIKMRDKFSTITDEELKAVIADLQKFFPNSGAEMMTGLLHTRGLTLQRSRVRKCLSEVNPPATAERWGHSVSRRVYKVGAPNSLWHIDGHMKLCRWGLVTNGCIDGYSRLITFIHCSTSNNARTVLDLFLEATKTYSMPARVRSDHGHENILVALFMNLTFGTNRGSHITGESVHNIRIERLWRDVFKDVIQVFYKEFYELEDEGVLDPSDDIHRYSLHEVYLESINQRLSTFQQAWNHHRVRTEGNRTPEQIWRDGMLECSLDNAAVGRVFNEGSWEERIEEMLRRHNLADTGDERVNGETNSVNSRLSQVQKEELQHILAGDGLLKDKFCQHSTKVEGFLR
ncbi:uncharacterized protein [Diadema antillarum]|uniref:uncharacterized protein n=1 Tax=Diadema antillarum TaxID=105358 RepID=UPI003A8C87C5